MAEPVRARVRRGERAARLHLAGGRSSERRPAASGWARASTSCRPARPTFPYHYHLGERGDADRRRAAALSLRTAERLAASCEEGEVVAFPRGERGAHQVANRTDERRGAGRQRDERARGGRPTRLGEGRRARARRAARAAREFAGTSASATRLDYWEGEEPPEVPMSDGRARRRRRRRHDGRRHRPGRRLGGYETRLHDPSRRRSRRAPSGSRGAAKGAERGRWSEEDAEAARERLRTAADARRARAAATW